MSEKRKYPKKSPLILILEFVAPILFFSIAVVAAGISLGAAIYSFHSLTPLLSDAPTWIKFPGTGVFLAISYYVYGFALMIVSPMICLVLGGRLKPYRGPAVTPAAMGWYVQATLVMLVRYSFLEFVTPTVYQQIFYRLMGMKLGSGVYINSTAVVDPSLIEMGDHVTIGGTASIMAHYSQGGFLVISPVKIGARATIGLRAVLMGGVEVGEGAKVLANSFVLPNTKIPAGETWGGIPAAPVDLAAYRNKET
ncbi:MAG: hypothetical protein KGQ59_11615 [Bdellovibrionales bacterium]|nr:hypothetical protein [Bdellovibrionales bacterium]